MYRVLRREHWLTPEDQIHVELGFENRALVRVVVHYAACINTAWVEVARFDNAHGRPHFHRYWLPVAERPTHATSLDAFATFALRDLFANWAAYREKMEMRR